MMLMVIKMKYTIYEYQKEYDGLFNQYLYLKNYLTNLDDHDNYVKKLKSSMYKNLDFLDEIVFQKLMKRKEYSRNGKIHTLYNQLTNEKITFEIQNNKIYIHSHDKNNIFFYIIYQNLENYVIIEEKL